MPDPKFCLSQVGGGGGDAEAESKGMKGNRLTFGLCPKYLSRDERKLKREREGEGRIIKSPLERPQLKGIRPRACHAEETAGWEGLADVAASMQHRQGETKLLPCTSAVLSFHTEAAKSRSSFHL